MFRNRIFYSLVYIVSCLVALSLGYASAGVDDNYALSTGSEDYRRLKYLNAAVNPYSLKLIKKYVKKGDSVIDIGCGPGILTEKIAKVVGKQGRVLGVDNGAPQITLAKRNASIHKIKNIDYKVLDVNELGSLNKKFDVAYIRFVLIHLNNPYSIISKLQEVLKPGGYVLIEELEGNDTIMSVPKDIRLDLVKKVDRLQEEIQKSDFSIALKFGKHLKASGFTIVSSTSVHPKLDSLPKRRNFSLGMRSLEKALLSNKKITQGKLHHMIKQVERMENNSKIDLYFYKIGQIAAVYNGSANHSS